VPGTSLDAFEYKPYAPPFLIVGGLVVAREGTGRLKYLI